MDINFVITMKNAAHLLKYVKVNTYSYNVYEGWLKDVDPLTGNLLLVNFEDNDSQNESVVLIQGHDCKSVEVVREDETMKNPIQHFFNKGSAECLSSSSIKVSEHKKRLISWLKKHRLDIEESEDNITVCNSVTIHSPYTSENCLSNNGRVLVMTKNLVSSMPETFEADVGSD